MWPRLLLSWLSTIYASTLKAKLFEVYKEEIRDLFLFDGDSQVLSAAMLFCLHQSCQ